MTFPLPYAGLKEYTNGPGYERNPFFGRWRQIEAPSDITFYTVILDTIRNQRYNHPNVTEGGVTRPARYFVKHGSTATIGFGDVLKEINHGHTFTHADTVEGPYLLVVDATNTHDICAAAYATWAAGAAAATRPVEPEDRQIHWVWFRKSPTWRLTEEIVLRAASWIELNPGYTFHLWTGLKDAAELVDFLADLSLEVRARYFDEGRITVHYDEEFREALFGWFAAEMPDLLDTFKQVWFSTERQDIVMKTDYARNILLAEFGGVYADFNDLVCVAPIEPVLKAHAGCYIGVTDNTSTENASNYFMYAGKGCADWLAIVKQCTATLQIVRAGIHSAAALELARDCIRTMCAGKMPSLDGLKTVFPEGFIAVHASNHFIHAILVAVYKTLGEGETAAALMNLDQRSLYGRYKSNFIAEATSILRIAGNLPAIGGAEFEKNWRYAVAHIYLRSIMYCSNLPIFCRQQRLPIHMLPFSYLLRYSCLLSFIGHIGDGTSYGGEVMKSASIRSLVGV